MLLLVLLLLIFELNGRKNCYRCDWKYYCYPSWNLFGCCWICLWYLPKLFRWYCQTYCSKICSTTLQIQIHQNVLFPNKVLYCRHHTDASSKPIKQPWQNKAVHSSMVNDCTLLILFDFKEAIHHLSSMGVWWNHCCRSLPSLEVLVTVGMATCIMLLMSTTIMCSCQ